MLIAPVVYTAVQLAKHGRKAVPPTRQIYPYFYRICAPIYGQKVKNTDVKSAPEGVGQELQQTAD